MIEHFKPAGHKAPTLTTAIALEETFKPIQRVVRNDKTIGYLFREVEYHPGYVEDIVLAKDFFLNTAQKPLYKTLPLWHTYLAIEQNNLYDFRIPSGPIMMELTYRTAQDKSTLRKEVEESIRTTYKQVPIFNTTVDYVEHNVHHTHLGEKQEPQPINSQSKAEIILSEDGNITTQASLATLLGRRAPHTNSIFSTYGTPVFLQTPSKENQIVDCALVLGIISDGRFYVYANNFFGNVRPARGVAGAQKILNMPGVEVHDD